MRSASVDDLDEDPLSLFGATGLHHGAQGLRGAAVAADHLPAILLGDDQLVDDRLVLLLELVDPDLVGIVDQRLCEELEQLLQAAIPLALRSFFTVPEGWAPFWIQPLTRSSSSTIVEGSVCGL